MSVVFFWRDRRREVHCKTDFCFSTCSFCGDKQSRQKCRQRCVRIRYTLCCGSCREKSSSKAVSVFSSVVGVLVLSHQPTNQPTNLHASLTGSPRGCSEEEGGTGSTVSGSTLGIPRGRTKPVGRGFFFSFSPRRVYTHLLSLARSLSPFFFSLSLRAKHRQLEELLLTQEERELTTFSRRPYDPKVCCPL